MARTEPAQRNASTREVILGTAVCVWLKADLDLLVSRTAGRTHRPLLNRGNNRFAFDAEGNLWIGQTLHRGWIGQAGVQASA